MIKAYSRPLPQVPSPEEVKGWKLERDRLDAELANFEAIKRQRDYLDALIKAAEPFAIEIPVGTPSIPATERPMQRRKRSGTWTSVVLDIVTEANRGLTYQEVKDEIAQSTLAAKLKASDKGFYGAIAKLDDSGKLVRHKGRLYTPASHKKFLADVAAGLAEDTEAPRYGQHSPVGEAIVTVMRKKRPSGATSGELLIELKMMPEISDTLERHKTHFYNVMARLVEKGTLMKGGGRYFLTPEKENGA